MGKLLLDVYLRIESARTVLPKSSGSDNFQYGLRHCRVHGEKMVAV